jgi:hypothetical protein
LFISRVELLLRAGVFRLLSGRLFIASRFEVPAVLVVAFLFTSLLRAPELTVPLVAGLVFPDLETFPPPPLLEFPGVYTLTDLSLTAVLPERPFVSNVRTFTLLPVVLRYSLAVGPL